MLRSHLFHCYVIIGSLCWLVIFFGQIIYFKLYASKSYCWNPPCREFFLSKSQSQLISRNKTSLEYSLLSNIHRQPLLRKYESQHVNFLRLIQPFVLPEKYLIYTCNQPCGGWGDRTRKIVGAFLLSLVLNRTFLINMTWPCAIDNLLEPRFIDWNRKIKFLSHKTNLTVRNLTSSDNDYRYIHSWSNTNIIYFQVKDLGYYSLLLWRSDFYRTLHELYGLHRSSLYIHNVFTLVYELLFKLKSHPQSHIDELAHKLQFKFLHCAHVRIGRNPSNPNDAVFPKREHMSVDVIRFLKNSSRLNQTIFVTTDSDEVRLYAQEQFDSRLLTVQGTIRHIDRSGKQFACDGFEKTILDFYMISHCQMMIMSKSAFSFWANMRRLKPYENLYLYCDGIKRIRSAGDYDRYPYGKC